MSNNVEAGKPGPLGAGETERARQERLLRTILRVVVVLASLALAGVLAFGTAFRNPLQTLLPLFFVFLVVVAPSYWLLNRGRLQAASIVYGLGSVIGVLVATYSASGTIGPVALILIIIPVLAALTGGYRAARNVAIVAIVLYLAMAVLEVLGVIQPQEMSEISYRIAYHTVLVSSLALAVLLVGTSINLQQQTLLTAERRSEELAEANLRAEQAAQAERQAREREELAAERLRQAVRGYSAFLEQVSAGEYQARLVLPVLSVAEGSRAEGLDLEATAEQMPSELLSLGERLNATVETLVTALDELKTVQRRYTREAWEQYGVKAAAEAAPRRFRYGPASADDAQFQGIAAAMAEALAGQEVAAREGELALPIRLHDEVIGALGAQRPAEAGWNDEEVALAETIADQLAQTMEGLRLLDETQRRAAEERLIGEVTGRLRQTLSVDAILQTAAQEMRAALDLAEVEVRMGTPMEGK